MSEDPVRIVVGDDPPTRPRFPVWIPIVVIVGVIVLVWGAVSRNSTTTPTTASPIEISVPLDVVPTTSSTVDPQQTPVSTDPGLVGLRPGEVVAVLGVERPQRYLRVVTGESTEDLVAMPWLAFNVRYDQSDQIFSFRGPATTGQAAYLGSGDKFVVYSEQVIGDWVWNTSEPATAAWIEWTEADSYSVMYGTASALWLGDDRDYLQVSVEAQPILPASLGQNVAGFIDERVILENTATDEIQVVSLEGETLAAATGYELVSVSPDSHVLVTKEQDGQHVLVVLSSDLTVQTELGGYARQPSWSGWSSDGTYLALIYFEVIDAYRGEFEEWLEIWNRGGQRILVERIKEGVPTGIWSNEHPSLLLAGADSEDWLRLDVDGDNASIEHIAGIKVSEFGYWIANP